MKTEKDDLLPCREAFEKWYIEYFGDQPRVRRSLEFSDKRGYAFASTQIEWKVWQAAWQTRPTPAPSDKKAARDIFAELDITFNGWAVWAKHRIAVRNALGDAPEVEAIMEGVGKVPLSWLEITKEKARQLFNSHFGEVHHHSLQAAVEATNHTDALFKMLNKNGLRIFKIDGVKIGD